MVCKFRPNNFRNHPWKVKVKTILNKNDNNLVIFRVNSLSQITEARWGKMNVNEMLYHCNDQIKMAEGKIEIKFVGNFFLTKIVKNLILFGIPAPKGKIMTYKELDQKIDGTRPTIFENDKSTLVDSIKGFDNYNQNNEKVVHPSFGKLSKKQWGRLVYIHLDHHLRQFGV